VILGLIWIVAGALQFQPFMFSKGFAAQVISPAVKGQPHWVGGPMTWSLHLLEHQGVLLNAACATVQTLIGLGLLFRRTVKPALVASVGWAMGVWWFGEGFGALLTGTSSPLTGAPGAVILYALVGVLVWPSGRRQADEPPAGPKPGDLPGDPGQSGARLVWAAVWLLAAALWLTPANRSADTVHDGLLGASYGWLAPWQRSTGHWAEGHGLGIAIGLAVLSALIGLGVFVPALFRAALLTGVILSLGYWALGQGFGVPTSGKSTDLNAGPLFVLLALRLWVVPHRSRCRTRDRFRPPKKMWTSPHPVMGSGPKTSSGPSIELLSFSFGIGARGQGTDMATIPSGDRNTPTLIGPTGTNRKVNPLHPDPQPSRWRGRTAVVLLASLAAVLLGLSVPASFASASTHGGSVPAHSLPNGDNGTTIDPLQYNCGNDAPSCGQVGESNGYYNGTNVDLLYSENFYCDANVSSAATTGCEVGAGPSPTPSAASAGGTGTSLGNTTHGDTLYIPVPLFANPPATQCVATATCIDHPPTIDLSRIAGALPGSPSMASVRNVPIPAHDHVVGTRNSGNPEWWNVEVVATTDPATFNTLTSVGGIEAAVAASKAITAPTNAFLFFQVLPGTLSASMAANLTATAPPGPAVATAPDPSPTVNQTEPGTTFNNLKNDCGATAPLCQNIGISRDWIDGQDVEALYTEQYFCDTSVSAASSSGCEAGAAPNQVPPGVADRTPPSPTVTNGNIDPLYIPVPLYKSPPVTYNQCSSAITCIDHPATIDLSRLASTLGASASSLTNVALPGHDHILTTRNGDQPEWWNVIVIPVTSAQGLATVESAKSYNAVKAQETVAGSGIGVPGAPEVPTNAYLWFQTLPGGSSPTPGPVQTNCMTHLPAGSVVGSAALDDGTGYYEVDSQGDVAVFGAATCYGAMTGQHLNQPIVGMAVDRNTGGYWLVAADGGVFSFNAPFYGSTGNITLNKPVVGAAPTLNGLGYYLVASDGGVFTFGNAGFHGSTGNLVLNKPVVGMGLDRATGGYWLVAADGGVFSFNAPFYGSTGAITLNEPVVGMAPVSDGSGYRLVASDGGVFDFNTPFYGSTGGMTLNKPVIAGLTNNSYDGYWLVASDGGVFTFGPPSQGMPFYGSAA